MSTLIQIKRTTTPNLPTANNGNLNLGELAYVYDTSSQSTGAGQNGKRLYIGNPTNPTDIPIKVGGQYYTDMMEHTKGVLTANSAILVDGNKKIDNLKVDNIDVNGNTVSTTSGALNLEATTNLNLDPAGSVRIKDIYNLPSADGTSGQVIVTDGSGNTAFADVATNLSITGDSGSDTISLLTDSLTYAGTSGISTEVDPLTNTVTISGDIATTTTTGVASFSASNFDVSGVGVVTPKLASNTAPGVASFSSTNFDVSGAGVVSSKVASTTAAGVASFSAANYTVSGTGVVTPKLATTTTTGVASFDANDFNVSAAGEVTLKLTNLEEYIEDTVANSVDGLIVAAPDSGISLQYVDNDIPGSDAQDGQGTLTISGVNATNTVKGVASFAAVDFAVSAGGEVTIGAGAVSNAQLAGSIENGKLTNSSTTFSGDAGTTNVSLGSALSVVGGTDSGISTDVTAGTLTISGVNASTTDKGVASFASGNFAVSTEGEVSIKTSGVATANIANDAVTTAKILDGNVTNAKLANSTTTLGSTVLTLGSVAASVAGITSLGVGNISASANTITTTNTNGNLILNPNGTGTIDVNSHKITSVADPTSFLDAANKQYVDSVAQGLQVKAAVVAATTANITGTYDNAAGTITLPQGSPITSIDGENVVDGNRILIKDQTDQTENGVYVLSGSGSLLTRASDSVSAADLTAGQFFFIQSGTTNGDAGFVQTNIVTTVGTDNIIYTQFSGAGSIIDGDGIGKTGNEIYVKLVPNGGLVFSADAIQIEAGKVTNAMLEGFIENAKLVNDSITVNGTEVLLGGSITLDSDDISQGSTNIYYTDALARAALSVTQNTGLTYNNTTGVLAGLIATYTTKGVASFSSSNFTVTNGAVSVTTIDGGSYGTP